VDLTAQYPLSDQLALYRQVLAHEKDTYLYLTKLDLVKPEEVKAFCEKHPRTFTSHEQLFAQLTKSLQAYD
jgi:GTP1/Obg family GTP-binding protein